jgi:hypothetical protein
MNYLISMDKKDIIIYIAVLMLIGLSLYRKYAKKKGITPGKPVQKSEGKNSLREQPDDYEPYSGRKEQP